MIWALLFNSKRAGRTDAKGSHFDSQLEQVVNCLVDDLGLPDVFAPDVDTVSPHNDCRGRGIFFQNLVQVWRQVFFVECVFNDGDHELVDIVKIAGLGDAGDRLDLFNVGDAELLVVEQTDHDGSLGVRVDTSAGVAGVVDREKERCACGGLVNVWSFEVFL